MEVRPCTEQLVQTLVRKATLSADTESQRVRWYMIAKPSLGTTFRIGICPPSAAPCVQQPAHEKTTVLKVLTESI